MTAALLPILRYDPSETAQSWAARLAAVHAGQPVNHLLKDMGVPASAFMKGDPEAIQALAVAGGQESEIVSRGAFLLRRRFRVLRGEPMGIGFAAPNVQRFCPHCLQEDGTTREWRHRILWCFDCIMTCPRHAVALACAPAGASSHDVRDVVHELGGLDDLAAASREVPVSDHVLWVSRRLQGQGQGDDWLASQSIAQVIDASEALGAVLEHGHAVRLGKLSREAREGAIVRGLGVLGEGEDAVMAAFDDIRAASSANAVQAGSLAMYGRLFEWLDRRTNHIDPGPIKRLLREHILRHDAITPGAMLLGETVQERRLHSLASLSEVTGIPRRRLTRLLKRLGHVPEGASDRELGRLVFPARSMEQLCDDLTRSVPLEEVPDYIGASIRQTAALRQAGILTPVVGSKRPGEVRQIVFAQRVLDDFLEKLAALPPVPDHDDDGVDIATACQRIGAFTEDLVARILSGSMPARRCSGYGLDKVRVRLPDVRQYRNRAKPSAERVSSTMFSPPD